MEFLYLDLLHRVDKDNRELYCIHLGVLDPETTYYSIFIAVEKTNQEFKAKNFVTVTESCRRGARFKISQTTGELVYT